MSKKFVFLNFLANGLRLGNIANIKETLTFTGTTVNIPGTVNGRKVQAVQNSIALNVPTTVLPDGCTDTCSALPVTLALRVNLSGPAESKEQLIAAWTDLKQIVDKAIIDDNILDGFKHSASDAIELAEQV